MIPHFEFKSHDMDLLST